ncbi:ABC transporter permease [Thermogemmatispora carboxidivorans]|uniref:ABC transporter permease n=1 Tax=Thermogemmatispora carboxidivorans TaxID=1382306 RepID=UPI0006992D64|nr:ABC transporter permease [Thermogemmatispora carboxidivorans]
MRYLLRRAGFYLIALWAAITFNFIIPRLMPGDPLQNYIAKLRNQGMSQATIIALRKEFGADPSVPLWQQYLDYLNALLHGQFGTSTSEYPTPVAQILSQSLPWTIGLVGTAVVLSFLIGTLLGILFAWRRGSWYDTTLPPALTFLSAVPYFWMALALLYVFGMMLNWFPTSDAYDLSNFPNGPEWSLDFIGSLVQHAALPVITLIIGTLAQWVLTMRNAMVTTLSEDYLLMAQAKGLPGPRVVFAYAARNAVLPSITSFSISLGLVVSGSLLTEIVFNYPGIGYHLFRGASESDYALIEGGFLILALTVLAANFLAELVYSTLDPRIRHGRA